VTGTFQALAGVVVGLPFGFPGYVVDGGFLARGWRASGRCRQHRGRGGSVPEVPA
jgi:hypothetical protein